LRTCVGSRRRLLRENALSDVAHLTARAGVAFAWVDAANAGSRIAVATVRAAVLRAEARSAAGRSRTARGAPANFGRATVRPEARRVTGGSAGALAHRDRTAARRLAAGGRTFHSVTSDGLDRRLRAVAASVCTEAESLGFFGGRSAPKDRAVAGLTAGAGEL